jgi:hypothetical protein
MRHAHGNCNAHRNSHSDANSDSYIYLDAHTNRNIYSNSNCDTHCYINADTYTASDPMREMFTHAEAPPNSSAATVARTTISRGIAKHRFRSYKRRQYFIGVHNETLSIVAMRVNNPDCSPFVIDG